MPKLFEVDKLGSSWARKIKAGCRYYDNWAKKFKCEALREYYEGFQWAEKETDRYIINLFFSTIEVKVPSLIFQNPIFRTKPKPKDLDFDPESAFQFALNMEDTLNDWAMAEDVDLGNTIERAIYDSFFRFGIVELGYSANWIDNPVATRPALLEDYIDSDAPAHRVQIIKTVKKLPTNEKLYIRHIPAKAFRVSTIDGENLWNCDWVGYYEHIRVKDLLTLPDLINEDRFTWTGSRSEEYNKGDNKDVKNVGDFVKVWKIWDTRLRQKFLFAENQEVLITNPKHYNYLPFADIRFIYREEGWYPVPLAFNWTSPQNEQNEIREAHRSHRRRFKRILTLIQGSLVDMDEKDKLTHGPDGTVVEVSRQDAVSAVPNADLGASASITLQTSKDDFNIVSGTTSEQRGESDRTTATQASITNNRSQIRENRERIRVATFIKKVGKIATIIINKEMINPIMLTPENEESEPRIIDPLVDFGDNMEFQVIIEIESMSPIANEEELTKFLKFITIVNQFPQIALSPILIREVAFRCGYKNERVIREFQQQAQLAMIGQISNGIQGLQQQMGPEGMPNAEQTAKQMLPPTMDEVMNQIREQGVPLQ